MGTTPDKTLVPPTGKAADTGCADSATKSFIDEPKVRNALAELAKERIVSNPFQDKSDGSKDPVTISLELGLGCVALMLNYELLTEEEQSRLANRVNVLLRAHPTLALPVQVKE